MEKLGKNKKLILVIVLALVVPLLVMAARQIQELRGRAAGSNEVGIRFSPESGTFSPGQQVTVKIAMHKLAQRSINVYGKSGSNLHRPYPSVIGVCR